MDKFIAIVFEDMPGPEGATFVEAENALGEGINVGEWVRRPEGYAVLRLREKDFQGL